MEKIGIQDTCGVNNLHGMPGVYAGILSIIFAALVTPEQYGSELGNIFEAIKVSIAYQYIIIAVCSGNTFEIL